MNKEQQKPFGESALARQEAAPISVDRLAQIIRRLDGRHTLGAYEMAEAILAEVSIPYPPAAQAVDLWQPIETAPKDGTIIIVTGAPELGYTLPCVVDALYDDGGWLVNQWESPSFAITPTHWMPIPAIDQQAGKGVQP